MAFTNSKTCSMLFMFYCIVNILQTTKGRKVTLKFSMISWIILIELGNVEFENGSRFELNFVRQYFFYYVLLADSFHLKRAIILPLIKKHFRTRQTIRSERKTLEICTKPKLLPEYFMYSSRCIAVLSCIYITKEKLSTHSHI
jgi:hypothetical protein